MWQHLLDHERTMFKYVESIIINAYTPCQGHTQTLIYSSLPYREPIDYVEDRLIYEYIERILTYCIFKYRLNIL